MIPEREREALMRLMMCAREECSMCKYQGDCNFDFQYELATKNMNILAEALRKTENCSEKPNNSAEQTEPTISKMEQVDKDINVRSKDEPQTDRSMAVGKRSDATADKYNLYGKTTTDEPQTDCPWK